MYVSENVGLPGASEATGGSLTVFQSTIRDNLAILGIGEGGGIWSLNTAATINSSTISNNHTDFGGGVWHSGNISMLIVNSTISGNFSLSGGGVLAFDGNVNLRHSTITGNEVPGFSLGGGGPDVSGS